MATLILTAVGTAVAGPVGGALGAVLGQAADQALLAPKPRHGPRLGDLAVQTSSYGSQIPKLFGTVRVAGTVIWATDLVETRSSAGGGKGRPRTVGYSYSANFAVALSARKVRAVRRIWADGKLLRGAAGDLKASTKLRIYDGDEDQPADPLIASAEGTAATPAHRGIAYAVFEGLELADFGNRIPSLTFEVEADAGPVAIGAVAAELSGGAVSPGATPAIGGYAATGDSIRSALAALAEPLALSLHARGNLLVLATAGGGAAVSLAAAEAAGAFETTRAAATRVPDAVTLSFYDRERGYQTGTQRAHRAGASPRTESISLPAVLTAAEAKAFAEARLAAAWAARSSGKLRLSWRRQALRPGALVRIEAEAGLWRVRSWQLAATALEIEVTRTAPLAFAASVATSGRAVEAADSIHGPTTLRLLDLPIPPGADGPGVLALAGGTSPGWRRAGLAFSPDGGASWHEVGSTADPAVLGRSLTTLAAGPCAVLDLRNQVEVELLNDGLWLESRSDAALAAGANLALLGGELIQFGAADPLGGGRFRLGRLLRGRRGTEWAVASHGPAEDFALLAPATMLALSLPAAAPGAIAVAVAAGIGDPPEGVRAEVTVTRSSLRPPSPVHLRARRSADGSLAVSWVRRSRLGWDWPSGADTPLAEEREAYVATISGGGGARTFEVAVPELVYAGAAQAADGIAYPVTISVVQVGTYAASPAATIAFS